MNEFLMGLALFGIGIGSSAAAVAFFVRAIRIRKSWRPTTGIVVRVVDISHRHRPIDTSPDGQELWSGGPVAMIEFQDDTGATREGAHRGSLPVGTRVGILFNSQRPYEIRSAKSSAHWLLPVLLAAIGAVWLLFGIGVWAGIVTVQ